MSSSRRYVVLTIACLGLGTALVGLYLGMNCTSHRDSIPHFSDQTIRKKTLLQGEQLYGRHCRTCQGHPDEEMDLPPKP